MDNTWLVPRPEYDCDTDYWGRTAFAFPAIDAAAAAAVVVAYVAADTHIGWVRHRDYYMD